jgi:hypothetical protein
MQESNQYGRGGSRITCGSDILERDSWCGEAFECRQRICNTSAPCNPVYEDKFADKKIRLLFQSSLRRYLQPTKLGFTPVCLKIGRKAATCVCICDMKICVLCWMHYYSVSQTFFKLGPHLLFRMFYGPPYSCPL